MTTFRSTRSWLFTPATRLERFAKGAEVGADIVILDLEDAVAASEKETARSSALSYLAQPRAAGPARALRINALDTHAGVADLHTLLASKVHLDYLVLPKTEGAGHLRILDRLLAQAASVAKLVAIIESARGLAAVDEIAAATPRLQGIMLGAADMAADLGAETAWTPLTFARARIIAASALADVQPIDAPYFDIENEAGLRSEVTDAVTLGFTAKAAIHPRQIQPINAALTPSADAVEKARAILAENAKGVGVVDGQMVDEAIARKARRVLATAEASLESTKKP